MSNATRSRELWLRRIMEKFKDWKLCGYALYFLMLNDLSCGFGLGYLCVNFCF